MADSKYIEKDYRIITWDCEWIVLGNKRKTTGSKWNSVLQVGCLGLNLDCLELQVDNKRIIYDNTWIL